jgi:hypothetical protein
MESMFEGATEFSQTLCWDYINSHTTSMFTGSSGSWCATMTPTSMPTEIGTVKVPVELSIAASAAPTSTDKATLMTTIATGLSVDATTFRAFVVTSTEARRIRRSPLSAVSERRLVTYTWAVSFSIVVSLSALTDDSITSASDFEATVHKFLFLDLEGALSAAGLEVSVESVNAGSGDYSYDDDDNDDYNTADEVINVAVYGAAALVAGALLLSLICVLKKRLSAAPTSPEGAGK